MTNENTDNTDEPTKAELHDRVRKLESTVEKLMPSRRDALRMGAAGIAGAAGLGAASQSAEASTGSAGQIGDVNNRPDVFADEANVNQVNKLGGDLESPIRTTGNQVINQGTVSPGTTAKDLLKITDEFSVRIECTVSNVSGDQSHKTLYASKDSTGQNVAVVESFRENRFRNQLADPTINNNGNLILSSTGTDGALGGIFSITITGRVTGDFALL